MLYVIIQLSSTRCCLCHSLWVFYWYRLISQESAENVRQALWTHARIAEPEHRTFCEKRETSGADQPLNVKSCSCFSGRKKGKWPCWPTEFFIVLYLIVLDFDLKKHGNYRIYSIDWVQCYLDSFDWGRLSALIEPSFTSYHGNSRISVGKVWTPVSTLIWRRSMISFSKYKRTFLVVEFVERSSYIHPRQQRW